MRDSETEIPALLEPSPVTENNRLGKIKVGFVDSNKEEMKATKP